ncbi:MAG TPA: hypothetical protein VGG38_17360 [Acidimicrobiales bacterium]|jgi:hypothetical protein
MHTSSRTTRTGILAGFVAVAAALTVAVPPSGASLDGTATLKLSGSAKGTLKEGPQGFCTPLRTGQGSGVDLINLVGNISAYKKSKTWSFTVDSSANGGGTFTAGPASGSANGQLDPIGATQLQSEANLYNSGTKGSFTVHGKKGTVNMTFVNGKKSITVKGSWDC